MVTDVKSCCRIALVLVSCLHVLVAAGCKRSSPPPVVNIITTSAVNDTHKWIIQWGEDTDGRLLFAAFEGVDPKQTSVSGLVESVSPAHKPTYGLVRTPRGQVRVPGSLTLFEEVDGVYRESKQTIDLTTFRAFLDSEPEEYTIAALVRFAEGRGRPESGQSQKPLLEEQYGDANEK